MKQQTIFLQEREKLHHCKKLLARVATENPAPNDSPLPEDGPDRKGEFERVAQARAIADDISVSIRAEHDIVRARSLGKDMAKQLGFSNSRPPTCSPW